MCSWAETWQTCCHFLVFGFLGSVLHTFHWSLHHLAHTILDSSVVHSSAPWPTRRTLGGISNPFWIKRFESPNVIPSSAAEAWTLLQYTRCEPVSILFSIGHILYCRSCIELALTRVGTTLTDNRLQVCCWEYWMQFNQRNPSRMKPTVSCSYYVPRSWWITQPKLISITTGPSIFLKTFWRLLYQLMEKKIEMTFLIEMKNCLFVCFNIVVMLCSRQINKQIK